MKVIPCSKCGKHAMQPPSGSHPEGTPALVGRFTSNPLVVKCYRCGRATRLTLTEFNRLPEMTLEDFHRLGFHDLPTRDLEGFGVKRPEAEDLFRQRWTVEELHSLSRDVQETT